ncbi:activating signal cointegrator 1 complex subunit [Dipsacomyces acuminosporus]|nr:activating signal cointegrator 1 complex subunit [Dipsacomyces acuminosporus]
MDGISIYEVGERRYRVRGALDSGYQNVAAASQGSSNGRTGGKHGKTERKTITVPRQLHRYLIGSQGATIIKIRTESRTKVTVPDERKKSDSVEIEGSAEEINHAEQLIANVVKENIHRVPYTHFLSLPISDLDVQRKVKGFQDDVSKEFFRNLKDSSFIDPVKLHITVGMLRLLTPEEVRQAVELLKSLYKDIYDVLDSKALVVSLNKPSSMEANPAKTRIVYLQVEDFDQAERLERVCNLVRSKFDEAGYIDEKRPLKIHATVIRASPKEPPSAAAATGTPASEAETRDTEEEGNGNGNGNDNSKRSKPVNAVPMLKKYGTLSFGTCRIGQIQVAKRFHFTDSGAYDNEGFVVLP